MINLGWIYVSDLLTVSAYLSELNITYLADGRIYVSPGWYHSGGVRVASFHHAILTINFTNEKIHVSNGAKMQVCC